MNNLMRILLSFFIACFISLPLMAEESAPVSAKPYTLGSEDKAALERVEKYLTDIHSLSAEFTQAAPSGDISSGMFYLKRPGRLRMEYASPTPVLMVARDNDIVYYDKELDQVTHIPLGSTLVGFLARSEVRFDDSVIITGVERSNGILRVTLVQSKHPKDGSLTLEFADQPLIIRNMIVSDSSGQVTTVSLSNAKFDVPLAEDLFVFTDPHQGSSRGIRK